MGDDLRPAALLLHTGAGRTSHFDLLLSAVPNPPSEARCAIAWRTATAVHALLPGQHAALEPNALHRGLYLSLDAPRVLDGHRGRTEPVTAGRWRPTDRGDAELRWTPHAPPWIVRFLIDHDAIDAGDAARLPLATRIERLA